MIKLYIAGHYSTGNILQILDNIRIGQRMATRALLAGFAPFCPWLDYQFHLNLREGETLTVEDYYRFSIEWLRASNAILMLPGWESSKGAKEEFRIADLELGLQMFTSLENAIEFYKDVLPKRGF